MTGQVLPLYIPQDVDMTAVKAQVAATGVSAPLVALFLEAETSLS
jgi:hypothetical protein